jgi:hypothetical protein
MVVDGLILAFEAGTPRSYPGSGTIWYDLSKNSRNGTLNNGVGYSTSNSGYLIFDGSNDSVTTPTINLGNGNIAWTVTAWVRTSTTANSLGQGSVLSNSSGGPVYSMMGINNGKIVYWTYQNSDWAKKLGVGTTVNNNAWHFLAWSNHSNYTMDMYVDGALDSNVGNSTSGNNNPVNMIGASWAGYLPGDIAQIYIYDRDLSTSQILQNFNAQKSRFGF